MTETNKVILFIFLVLLALELCACAKTPSGSTFKDTLTGITPTEPLLATWEETTPVIWHGALTYVHSTKLMSEGGTIEVINGNGDSLGTGPTGLGFISAIVVNDRLYVFGVTGWGGSWTAQNAIQMTYTDDLSLWSEPVTIKTAVSGQTFFNTSVAPGPNGFVMAYEVCELNMQCFSFRFMESEDLKAWTDIGERYSLWYSACPTIRYLDGWYYVFYLNMGEKQFFTVAARSRDLKNWQVSEHAVLTPWVHAPGSKNTSDFDFVEFNGHLEMVYIDGNQVTTGKTWKAVYQGTTAEFFSALF